MSSDHVRFREVQRFRQPWLMALLALGSGVSMSVFGCGIHRQLVMGDPWGQRPMSDSALLVVSIVTVGLTVGLLALFWRSALVVEVRGDGVTLDFWPLTRCRVGFPDIVRVESCIYRPIREYGGWGVRRGAGGRAHNVSGNRGVRLYLADGARLLIGSRRERELAAAIETGRGV